MFCFIELLFKSDVQSDTADISTFQWVDRITADTHEQIRAQQVWVKINQGELLDWPWVCSGQCKKKEDWIWSFPHKVPTVEILSWGCLLIKKKRKKTSLTYDRARLKQMITEMRRGSFSFVQRCSSIWRVDPNYLKLAGKRRILKKTETVLKKKSKQNLKKEVLDVKQTIKSKFTIK